MIRISIHFVEDGLVNKKIESRARLGAQLNKLIVFVVIDLAILTKMGSGAHAEIHNRRSPFLGCVRLFTESRSQSHNKVDYLGYRSREWSFMYPNTTLKQVLNLI